MIFLRPRVWNRSCILFLYLDQDQTWIPGINSNAPSSSSNIQLPTTFHPQTPQGTRAENFQEPIIPYPKKDQYIKTLCNESLMCIYVYLLSQINCNP
ncbi:unnamed protein product [Allacma fusca]|uniref:Uncharacterized protein n=1 Tax=Allacma fusca TaxID=39272 RepID=A0A8J2K401_9HEXA|nr:unnamed protein product [Allacma fusca]